MVSVLLSPILWRSLRIPYFLVVSYAFSWSNIGTACSLFTKASLIKFPSLTRWWMVLRFFLKPRWMLDKILLDSRNNTRYLLIIRSMVLQTHVMDWLTYNQKIIVFILSQCWNSRLVQAGLKMRCLLYNDSHCSDILIWGRRGFPHFSWVRVGFRNIVSTHSPPYTHNHEHA